MNPQWCVFYFFQWQLPCYGCGASEDDGDGNKGGSNLCFLKASDASIVIMIIKTKLLYILKPLHKF